MTEYNPDSLKARSLIAAFQFAAAVPVRSVDELLENAEKFAAYMGGDD
jgi:hypothetical protein